MGSFFPAASSAKSPCSFVFARTIGVKTDYNRFSSVSHRRNHQLFLILLLSFLLLSFSSTQLFPTIISLLHVCYRKNFLRLLSYKFYRINMRKLFNKTWSKREDHPTIFKQGIIFYEFHFVRMLPAKFLAAVYCTRNDRAALQTEHLAYPLLIANTRFSYTKFFTLPFSEKARSHNESCCNAQRVRRLRFL